MNSDEFEAQMEEQGFIVIHSPNTYPSVNSGYAQLLPEDMIEIAADYSPKEIYRKSIYGGFGYYVYGYRVALYIEIKNNTTGGIMNPVEEYFSQHKVQLWIFKNSVVLFTPLIAAAGIEFLQNSDLVIKGTIIAALTALNYAVSKLDPQQKWEGVGAKKKK